MINQNKLAGQRIGYIGLGNMGLPGARHLLAAGADLVVWNRTRDKGSELLEKGARRADSLRELAEYVKGGIVCLNLTHTHVVREIVLGEAGLAGSLDAEALVIDFGTTSVEATKEFAQQLRWLDAPVSGGQTGAEQASLTIMVGGSEQDFERAKELLHTVGKRVTRMGESGAGQVTKLANQLIVAQTIDAVAQAIRMAERAGVDPSLVREALMGGFAESRILQLHGERMINRSFQPGGRAELQLKDVRLICELAQSIGFSSPTLDNCLRQWELLVDEKGLGQIDHSGLFELYR
ncbi:MAG: NAD(P)-dependent oxidoreductase [Pirellula sp.]|nr:NAD(P)-dependent oxidoreductase [Pirellula sp.]